MTKSDRDTINDAVKELNQDLVGVPRAISTLMGIAAPKGDATTVQQASDGFKQAASQVDTVAWDLAKTASHQLPQVWIGRAADSGAEIVVAAANDLGNAATVFSKVQSILLNLSQGFAAAHAKYDAAQEPLHRAATACESADYENARGLGNAAATDLLAAIDAAETAAADATTRLTTLTDEAHAHAMKTGNLDAADKLVLSEAAIPAGTHADNEILSESDAERAAQRLDQLSPDDRRKMDDLLAGAKSPQERAYLMKTLAAGHSLDEVTQFGNSIHGHGDDPTWLQNKLTPIVSQTTAASVEYWDGTYDSQGNPNRGSWTQGQYPTCVASSTVMARAMIDPSYALGLTTGNKPDDPSSTSKDAFLERLRAEQAAVYDHGRDEAGVGDWLSQHIPFTDNGGMTRDEGQQIANEDIGKYTGQHYSSHSTDDAGDRRSILPEIERAVDQGQPVPFQTTSGKEGHQMLIIGHDGDRLEVYNPWGITSWITVDQFVNGHVGDMPGPDGNPQGVPQNVDGVLLPRPS
ncbi:hypothetical protein C5E44_08645 [Nocardia nova]|uniref:hypothetical protein n=1 Tax=Nocardia nova TaxID=37330 RepID=UPI000CE9C208|nr:hypothetical protein C5E44_08645 [Nocardia nova]